MSGIELLTAGLALLGAYVGYRQWRNAKNKTRLELYPKRVAVFRCTEEFLARAWHGPCDDQEALLAAYYHCKREAHFLFNKKLAEYLDSLYEGVEDHFHLENRLEIEGEHLDFDERAALQGRVFGSRHWLGEQNMRLKEHFKRHLDLSGGEIRIRVVTTKIFSTSSIDLWNCEKLTSFAPGSIRQASDTSQSAVVL